MIYMFLANGFEEVEALCPLDLLRRAGVEVTTLGVGGRTVTGAHGITVTADGDAADFSDNAPEGIILPGGMPGTANLDTSADVDRALRAAYAGDALICAICAAPSVIGKRGMLRGVKAVCFPGYEEYLEGRIECGCRAVRDGRFITAVGMGASMEFGLAVVAALRGQSAADKLAAAVLAPGSCR